MAKLEFTTYVDSDEIDIDDAGAARMVLLDDGTDKDTGVFLIMHSWDEDKQHEEFEQFEGRMVKITIETIMDS